MNTKINSIILLWLIMLVLTACSHQALPKIPDGYRNNSELSPKIISTGDTIQISYFINNQPAATKYKIGYGDILRVEVADHPELNPSELSVLPDGRISLSLIGPINVVDRSIDEVSEELAFRYRNAHVNTPKVVVSVQEGQQRLMQFMRHLGGGKDGSKLMYRVYDNSPINLPFIGEIKTYQPLESLRTEVQKAYQEVFGDQLEVTVNLIGRKFPRVYVMGEVKSPGVFEFDRKTHLLNAIAMAGGFADTANEGEVLLVRFVDEGLYDYWGFDLKDGLFSVDQPAGFSLSNNDVIWVSRSGIANVNLFVEQYIKRVLPVNLGASINYIVGEDD